MPDIYHIIMRNQIIHFAIHNFIRENQDRYILSLLFMRAFIDEIMMKIGGCIFIMAQSSECCSFFNIIPRDFYIGELCSFQNRATKAISWYHFLTLVVYYHPHPVQILPPIQQQFAIKPSLFSSVLYLVNCLRGLNQL